MNIRDIFALNLRTLRHARGYSQEELADRANIHRTYVSALERCQYSATIDMVASLAKVLGVDAAALLRSRAEPDLIESFWLCKSVLV
ncbi:helix-turn-helix domain-containing protein [Sinorhizobium medicae]|nr:helix-turn-helix domain-containing protein [Sinorhizobium medicae]